MLLHPEMCLSPTAADTVLALWFHQSSSLCSIPFYITTEVTIFNGTFVMHSLQDLATKLLVKALLMLLFAYNVTQHAQNSWQQSLLTYQEAHF